MRREHEKPRKNRKVDESTKERKDKQENVEEQSKLAKSGKKLNKKAMMLKRIVANEGISADLFGVTMACWWLLLYGQHGFIVLTFQYIQKWALQWFYQELFLGK